MANGITDNLRKTLNNLPDVKSVNDVEIKDNLIENLSFNNESLGSLVLHRLTIEDSGALYDFYFEGLSDEARNLFPPYPLFSPPVETAEELAGRIADWGKEDDWTVLLLTKEELIIGVCLLKRWSTERPTSGLAIREGFRNSGLGFLLQTVVNEQALLLGLDRVCATVAPDNAASLKVHQRSGFRKTGKMVPHYGYKNGIKEIERYDVELVLELKNKSS